VVNLVQGNLDLIYEFQYCFKTNIYALKLPVQSIPTFMKTGL